MSYLVLARKYRPKQFSELVGQQHVAQTLLNSFRFHQLGQAYLFTGTRGVGKTSVARIFAKALRCENPDSQPGGKTPGIACEVCASCLELSSSSSLDVLEIDGASNNGVENVREIREQVKFLPSRGKKKVYIIDEVHMLTTAAFNALLKTLEEPPAHVTFLLATTEVHKIPATILSRCQRFDFRRVPQRMIVEHLASLCRKEGIEAEAGALNLVAKKGDGSLRDSLSALDQCIALAGKKITNATVAESLGLAGQDLLLEVLQKSLRGEIGPAVGLTDRAFLSGVEIKTITIGLLEMARHLLFAKVGSKENLNEFGEEEALALGKVAQSFSPEALQAAYRVLFQLCEEVQKSPLPKASLEVGLVRLHSASQLLTIGQMLANTKNGVLGSDTRNEIATQNTMAPPLPEPHAAPPPTKSLEELVQFTLKRNPALGALLEHSITLTPIEQWVSCSEVRLGFRKDHRFFFQQASQKMNLEQLQTIFATFMGRSVPIRLEAIAEVNQELSSPAERTKQSKEADLQTKKKDFLSHPILEQTKEIFGADLSSFDIDRK
jgi:DNA polymerase III subunit gamma/tau